MLERKHISEPELHRLFYQISAILLDKSEAEIAAEYDDHIIDLLQIWQANGYIEVYEQSADHAWGRVKRSDLSSGSVPWYMGLYHARVLKSQNDPLIVITFEPDDDKEKPIIRFILTHDIMFGSLEDKHFPEKMRKIRKTIDEFIQLGNSNNYS